ncbi:SMP-30/gluconolactonase/LRE family protein [Maridesulfovibrio zosterae]|uniref:SMP-30/gluconolactonase/LRE family protein n=1 Tax=Maridesulfovibrio zosterae TaxID=82171 RepID=UPI0004101F42|nr:hypothetical protein [Maridesulfovibrio zosterae]
MRKYSVLILCIFFIIQAAACTTKTVKIEGFASPESVISDGTYFYVSNVGEKLKPMDKDGDGFISRLSADGAVIERKFISNLNAPKGMVVLNGVLYVADIDRVKGFSVTDGSQVYDLDFSDKGTSLLNDITILGDGKLLVSATDTGALYEFDSGDSPTIKSIETDVDLSGPNGIVFDPEDGSVYIASYGKNNEPNGFISKGRIKNGRLKSDIIHSKGGFYDGIALYDGKVLFSDWVAFEKKGVIVMLNSKSGESSVLDTGEEIAGPADFYLDKNSKKMWIPMMMENKILIVSF